MILVVASPGSGKSALCRRLVTRFPTLAHISVGALLRETAAVFTAVNKAALPAFPNGPSPYGVTLNATTSAAPAAANNGVGVITPQQRAQGEEMRRRMKLGLLIDDEVVIHFLVEAIKKRVGEGYKAFLIEGFPRTRGQAESFESWVRRDCVKCCVGIEATPEAKLRRLRFFCFCFCRFVDCSLMSLWLLLFLADYCNYCYFRFSR